MIKTMFQYPDADSIGLVDQDPDPDAGSGSRQADFVTKKEKNEEFSGFHAKNSFLTDRRPPVECIASWKFEKKCFSSKNIRSV